LKTVTKLGPVIFKMLDSGLKTTTWVIFNLDIIEKKALIRISRWRRDLLSRRGGRIKI
jgi:hypothetical protein